MAFQLLFVLPVAILSMASAQSICDSSVVSPMVFPIHNVTLQGAVLRRGVGFSPGTPPQPLAFFPYPAANNSFIYDGSGLCTPNIPSAECVASNGGLFDEASSTTWSQNSDQSPSAYGQEDYYSDQGDIFGTDTLQLNSTLSLKDFTLGINRNQVFATNAIGLSRNSTLLNKMLSARLIASRAWSVFWGLTGADTTSQMNGNLVFGGYDAAKASGTNSTTSISEIVDQIDDDSLCRTSLMVTVTALTMNLVNGSNENILGGSQLQMCIDPSYPLITLPEDVWNNWENVDRNVPLNRSYGINLWGLTYAANSVYDGNLTFTISSGLSITIPNHQLVVPDLYINENGIEFFNDSTRELMINPLASTNGGDFPILGQTFLTSAYMMVNYDTNQLTLWQANTTEDENLVAVSPSSTCKPANSPQTAATSSGATSQATPKQDTQPQHTGLSAGAIAGAAIGGVMAVMLITLACLYLRRARKQRAVQASNSFANNSDNMAMAKEPLKKDYDGDGALHVREIQELPGEHHAYEMGPERPHEMGYGVPHELSVGEPKQLPPIPRR